MCVHDYSERNGTERFSGGGKPVQPHKVHRRKHLWHKTQDLFRASSSPQAAVFFPFYSSFICMLNILKNTSARRDVSRIFKRHRSGYLNSVRHAFLPSYRLVGGVGGGGGRHFAHYEHWLVIRCYRILKGLEASFRREMVENGTWQGKVSDSPNKRCDFWGPKKHGGGGTFSVMICATRNVRKTICQPSIPKE